MQVALIKPKAIAEWDGIGAGFDTNNHAQITLSEDSSTLFLEKDDGTIVDRAEAKST